MNRLLLAAVFAATASAALAVDAVEGVWQTRADYNGHYGHVQITPCGPAFCGTLITAFDASGAEIASPNLGKRIVWDLAAYPGGLYDDGKVWSPDRNKTYNADMTLAGDTLSVRGCVLGICRNGGTWKRVK